MSAPYLLAALAVLTLSHTIAYLGGWVSRRMLKEAQPEPELFLTTYISTQTLTALSRLDADAPDEWSIKRN